jgi:serine/threonine protein kinase
LDLKPTISSELHLSNIQAEKIIEQMNTLFDHLHNHHVCHGDLYAHNILMDESANIIFGDFGAASMYHMLSRAQQEKIRAIEKRALTHFIHEMNSLCK